MESVLARVQALQGTAADGARRADGTATISQDFTAALNAAKAQQGVSAMPPGSLASGLPVVPASAFRRLPNGIGTGLGFGAPASALPLLSALPNYATGSPGTIHGTVGVGGVSIRGGSAIGQRMVALAQQEIGVRESPPGSNDGPRIAQYRQAVNGSPGPGPWCAYFVSYVAKQAGAPIGANGGGTGWVPTIESWGRQTGRYFTGRLPQPGDIVIFERNGDGTADHTGIVEYVDANGKIHTIEGNTSGQAVQRRDYSLNEIKGFVRVG